MNTQPTYLVHHGIKGQRWGVRRYQNEDGSLTSMGQARQNYKDSKKELKTARKNLRKTVGITGLKQLTIKGIDEYEKANAKVRKSEIDTISAKAKYKAYKAKNAERAEFNTYRKEMQKTGLRNSLSDKINDHRSTEIYNKVAAEKGKEYADRMEKSVQNRAVATLVGSAVALAGEQASNIYLAYKY